MSAQVGRVEDGHTCIAFLGVHGDVADAATVRDVFRPPRNIQDGVWREEEREGEARRVDGALQLPPLLNRHH